MPIVAGDIVLRLTTGAGSGSGNSATSTPAASLGGTFSTSAFTTVLFDDIGAAANEASEVDYRAFVVVNTHATLTLVNAKIYLSAQGAGGADVDIAVDNIGPVAVGAAYPQAARITSDTATPTGVGAFSAPTTAGAALALGDIPPGQGRVVWARRSAHNTAAQADSASFTVRGETAA